MSLATLLVSAALALPPIAPASSGTSAPTGGPTGTGTADDGTLLPPVDQGGPDAIIHGDDAEVEDYPQSGAVLTEASVRYGSGNFPYNSLTCSSTLIAPDVVMLAAHCVDPQALSLMSGGMDIEVEAYWWSRQTDLSDYNGMNPSLDWPEDAVRAPNDDEHVVWNSNFDLMGMDLGVAQNFDIGLLFLEESAGGQWAYLPTADEATQIEEDVEVDVVGWGQQTASQSGPYGTKQVGTSFINELGDHEFQVGAVEDDVRKCHGDSGGPSFWHATTDSLDSLRVIGVTSHSYDMSDCDERGGVDTRVDAFLEWIDNEMRSRCEDGTRAWCEQPGIPALPYDDDEDGILDWQDDKVKKGMCSATSSDASALAALLGIGAVLSRRRGNKAA